MDLRLMKVEASTEERGIVDAFLSGIDGEPLWDPPVRNRHERRRHLLLPALHGIQERFGWIRPGALNYLCQTLSIPPAEAYGVATFYGLFSVRERPPLVAHVCDDVACVTRGAEKLCARLEVEIGAEGESQGGRSYAWFRSPCLGQCERGPAALVSVAGESPDEKVIVSASAEKILESLKNSAKLDKGTHKDSEETPLVAPQAGASDLRLLKRIGRVDPLSFDEYRASEGYKGLRRALELGPQKVIEQVLRSGLVGRGGAAFPTGRKWQAVAGAGSASRPPLLVCNADESEPGTFKDRVLMEEDPFAVIEGMTIAAFATGCRQGYLYVRGEYPKAVHRLENAIRLARRRGFLGRDIQGKGIDFEIAIRKGAGAYICGEETALFRSIEGYRGEPQNKPPFPTEKGLFGLPTLVNNVETLVNVPWIVRDGADRFASIGTSKSTGTKLFCVSGNVRRPGTYEIPFGWTLGELIGLAGGVPDGQALKAVLLGGAAGTFVSPEELDLRLTFEDTRSVGASLGSAAVVLFDESVDLRRILIRIAKFFRDESCGQCVPCRVGAVRQEELLQRLVEEKPWRSLSEELGLLEEIGQVMRDASICGLGHTASLAVQSALQRWPLFESGSRP